IRGGTVVVLELFGTIADRDPGALADELVMRGLVVIWKSSPPAHVIDNHHTEIRHPGLDDLEQVLQPPSALDGDPGLPSIEEGANNAEIVSGSVKGNGCGLIGDRVLLMVGAHAHVFRGTKAHGRIRLLLPGSGIDGKVSHI